MALVWQGRGCRSLILSPQEVFLSFKKGGADALEIVYGLFNEIRSVAERKGIILSADLMNEHIAVTQKLRGFNTSMYEDFVRGRPTEIDYFNGYVCREGVRLGVPVPVNCTIVSLVKAISCRSSKLS